MILLKSETTSMSPERTEFAAPPDYETKSQVARRLNVSKRTIDNLMRQRRLPFIKLTSKIVRFSKAEVDAFLARNFRVQAFGQETAKQD
jgi:excisionase family DNA binding protein